MKLIKKIYSLKGPVMWCSPKGITLVELLVAMGIFSVIAMSIYMTFSNGILFSRRFQNSESIYRDMRSVADQLSKDLENLVPYAETIDYGSKHEVIIKARTNKNVSIQTRSSTGADDGGPGVLFVGTNKDLTFVVATATGLKQVSYYLGEPEDLNIHQTLVDYFSGKNRPVTAEFVSEDNRRLLLVREIRPFPYVDLEDIKDEIEIEILSPYIQEDSLKFSYAFHEGKEGIKRLMWQEAWDEDHFPLGVQMEAAFFVPQGQGQFSKIRKRFLIPLGMPPAYAPQEGEPNNDPGERR